MIKSVTGYDDPGAGWIFVFVPEEIGMRSAYEGLKEAGMREWISVGGIGLVIDEGRVEG